MKELRNISSKAELKKRLRADGAARTTVSFYKYHPLENPEKFRDELYANFEGLGVLGRVYAAREGVNAQISVPTENFERFRNFLYSYDFLSGVRLNVALEDDGKSFSVLHVRVRQKIVADGIDDPDFSMENRGAYVHAAEFNRLAENPDVVIVDMRNHYEYEVGHFENALEIPSDTFREQLPLAAEMLANKKNQPVIMYCTGGIRCEKASAYLKHKGFEKVFHLEGGIIEYVRQVKNQNLENKFTGKNFVFDDRLSERVGDRIISRCHQCGAASDTHTNCANRGCHLLFIQCENCRREFENCCGAECRTISRLPEDEQKNLRRGKSAVFGNSLKFRQARFGSLKDNKKA